MKVLQVSATDQIGGAGIAAYRLHQGLCDAGVDSQMLVMRKATANPTVHRLSSRLNRWGRIRRQIASRKHQRDLQQNSRKSDSAYWSLNHHAYPIADVINSFDADVVHLHWVGDNFVPASQLSKIKAPIIWTLHDMWAFTGGCHYAGDCTRYQQHCGNCPQLKQPDLDDISQRVHQHKQMTWLDQSLVVVCPSQWLADCAHDSTLLGRQDIHIIPNGIDTTRFKPLDAMVGRDAFSLPDHKNLVLFGAFGGTSDPRKGFHYLHDALQRLPDNTNIELVVFGSERSQTLDVGLPVHQVGRLNDTVSMALLYSACDAFVLPSVQDNLPNTILEALACGTACVAFDVGGLPDMIHHHRNGYLASFGDVDDLAQGIHWAASETPDPTLIHDGVVERYALPHITGQYLTLYQTYV